ncbi:hypothetical protein [Thorsellia anophelis]|uniref:NIPSNAP protein n=1 Tax=Thorsellia anophelis DSM 18579 TaxID=1123402 RepID=A0A1I0BQA4_9GAMM|nr:hypothetical protein [Thorsellia anophelis]SET08870.1 hypothetical protein SAMN02583745_01351 [Thorsellia anophelis DSM 18579]
MSRRRYIELMTYELKKEQEDAFHDAEVNLSIPLHKQMGIKVVSFGPSLHDRSQYLLIRAFNSEIEYAEQLANFYACEEWLKIREEIVSRIISAHKITFWLEDDHIVCLKNIVLN